MAHGRWRCRGSRTAALGGVVAVPTRRRERDFVLFPSPLFFVPSFSVRLTRDHSLLFSVLFKKTSLPSFLFSNRLSLSSVFFSPLFSPSVSSVFIGEEKVVGPLLVRLGAGFTSGWSATTSDSKAPLPCFRRGERPVVGH